ncbi:MAG: glycosyltransferase family 4 protein [Proteiniphilum sp.]
MKILHVLYELKFSGAEIMYVDAAPLFQEMGCQLTVMATGDNPGDFAPHFQKAGYRVMHRPYPRGLNIRKRIKYYVQFIRLLKSNHIDVVHIHVSAFMFALTCCTWLAGRRSVYTFHNVYPSHRYSYLYHVLQRWAAKNIFGCKFQTISDSVHDHERNYYHNKTKKIYNWYGAKRYFPSSNGEKKRIREELNIPDEALVLISVGGCSDTKRHTDIIRALPFILKVVPSVIYLHLGEGEKEPEEKEMTMKMKLDSHVRFYGNQTDVRKFLIASDVYVMTSKYEGISITTIEAMACGIPAILYNVPGLRDFNKSGENSCLIAEDHLLLAEKVVELYSNPVIFNRLSVNARELVNNLYQMENNVPEIFNLYNP